MIDQKTLGLMMSLNRLIETREGFDYTANDWAAWMKEAILRDADDASCGTRDSANPINYPDGPR